MGRGDRPVQVAVGDTLFPRGNMEIFIKDDKVVDIRER